MRDWPPATTTCPNCGHTVRIPITATVGTIRDDRDRPVTSLRVTTSIGPHVCRTPDQTPGE